MEEHTRTRIVEEQETEVGETPLNAAAEGAEVGPLVPAEIAEKDVSVGETSSKRTLGWQVMAMAVLALALAGLAYLVLDRRQSSRQHQIKSLAVLPLKSLSGEADDYLGLGIADTIVAKVSQVGDLTVRPTSAVRKYARQEIEAMQAARELKVDSVLDGTLQRSGDRLRVSVNLLRVLDGKSLWADHIDVQVRDFFAIQDEVARQVADHLHFRLSPAQQARLSKRSTSNLHAYEYFLKGKHNFERRGSSPSSKSHVDAAISMFRKAVEVDPQYGLAQAYLAFAYTWMALFVDEANPEWMIQVKLAMRQAELLDPGLAELHLIRHEILWSHYEGFNIEAAIRELYLAQQLDPSIGHDELGVLFAHLGLEGSAIRELKRALEIDPTNLSSQGRYVHQLVHLGKLQEAMEAHLRFFSRPGPILAYLWNHQLDEAEQLMEKEWSGKPLTPINRGNRALFLALKGKFQEAEAEIPVIAQGHKNRTYHHMTFDVACVYAIQGKPGSAVEWLRKTVEYGMPNYPLFARHRDLDRIRKDPGFIELMAELKPRWERYRQEFQ